MTRPLAADDFDTIRARMEELRRERDAVTAPEAAAEAGQAARQSDDSERRRRARAEGSPPPWVPTIFVKRPRR